MIQLPTWHIFNCDLRYLGLYLLQCRVQACRMHNGNHNRQATLRHLKLIPNNGIKWNVSPPWEILFRSVSFLPNKEYADSPIRPVQ
jgi:hypothetical protein